MADWPLGGGGGGGRGGGGGGGGTGVEVVVCKSMTKASATIFYIVIKTNFKKLLQY